MTDNRENGKQNPAYDPGRYFVGGALVTRCVTALALVACVFWLWLLWGGYRALPPSDGLGAVGVDPGGLAGSESGLKMPDPAVWGIFRGGDGAVVKTEPSAKRFRLAGTFLIELDGGEQRRAIVDDLSDTGGQYILRETERIPNTAMDVVRITRDSVIVRESGREETWVVPWLGQGSGLGAQSGGAVASTGAVAKADGPSYGIRQIGANRWVFNREGLLRYYAELRNEPERMLHVFDSLGPVDAGGGVIAPDDRSRFGAIAGYKLHAQGEQGFFRAAGLQEGDIVRSVNSVPMTNRRRAEFFIQQFVENKGNAFVLEVERPAGVEKLIYEVAGDERP